MLRPLSPDERRALVDGALIALGGAGVLDVLLVHGVLGLHQALPGPSSDLAEAALLLVSGVALAAGLLREWSARRPSK